MHTHRQSLPASRTPTALQARTLPWWLALACLSLLASCGRAPAHASEVSPAKATQAASAPVRATVAQAWSTPETGCSVLDPGFSSSRGKFRVLDCHARAASAPEQGNPPPVELQFQHLGPTGQTSTSFQVAKDDYSAIVSDALVPQFWDDHLVTLQLERERGGLWVIANWTGSAFVLTPYEYITGDEDGLQVTWYDDGFTVTTQPEGQRRLLTGGPDSQPGVFANESVACTDDSSGISQKLRLGLDTEGSIFDLLYSSAVPAGDGTSHVCLIQSAHGGPDSWQRAGNGDITIDIPSNDDAIPDSQLRIRMDQAQPEQTGDGTPAVYKVVLDVVAASFCGQSDAIADEIVLNAGSPRCASIRMHDRSQD